MAYKLVMLLCIAYLGCTMGQQVYRFDTINSRIIVDIHNEARKATGATAMKKLVWHNDLAEKAAEVVAQCRFRHSVPYMNAGKLGFDHVGENVFAISSGAKPTPDTIARSFLKEQANFDPTTGRCRSGKRCGHYTQAVWASSEFIGCAMAACDDIPGTSWSANRQWILATNGNKGGHLATCLYGPGGNYAGEKPYVQESSSAGVCSKCSLYGKNGISYGCDGDGLCVRL